MKRHAWLPLLLLTGCSLVPGTDVPTDRIPQQWVRGEAAAAPLAPVRWSDLGSAELDRLITEALANNTDIAAALARIEQSRASAKIAGAGLYPQLDASGSLGRTRTDSGRMPARTADTISGSLALSYELDLWQKNRNMRDAALWQLQATEQDNAALVLLVASEVARLYTGVVAFNARMDVAEKNLAYAREVLRVTELRHREGAISGLEEAQQRTSVGNTEAALASLKNQRDIFFHQLAQVVGKAPAQLQLDPGTHLAQFELKELALTTPWELLQQRPDIAAAEARLRAADIDIGVARANALPGVSLGLNGGLSGNPTTTMVGLAASFFAPIFRGGALEGAIERSEAVRDERIASYQSVLLSAFREVEDALSNYEAAVKRRAALKVAADEAQRAEAIARARFTEGGIDFTTLVTTQAALLQAEDSYLSAVQAQLAARIDLMRALGNAG